MTGTLALSRRQLIVLVASLYGSRDTLAADHAAHVTAVTFAPDGQQIIAGSQAGVVVSDAAGKIVRSIPADMDNVHDLCFSPDGDSIAVAGGTPGELGVVEIFGWPDGELRQRIEAHDDVVYQVALAANGSKWVTASADEVCTVFAMGKDVASARFTKHSRAVLAVTMLPTMVARLRSCGDPISRHACASAKALVRHTSFATTS